MKKHSNIAKKTHKKKSGSKGTREVSLHMLSKWTNTYQLQQG